MRQINESLRYESSQTIPRPMQNPGSEESSDQTYGGETVNNYRDSSVPSRTIDVDRSARASANVVDVLIVTQYGHFSRNCKKPRRRDEEFDESEKRWFPIKKESSKKMWIRSWNRGRR